MGLLVVTVVTVGAFALLWWIGAQNQPKRKRKRGQGWAEPRASYRRSAGIYEDDTGYESPLGLVDDPDDEWMEWAIMDDMLDGDDGDGW